MRQPDRIVRLKTVLARTGLSRSTIYRKIAEGTFPAQIKISTNGAGWKESDINRWVANPVDPAMLRFEQNLEALTERLPAPLLGVTPFQADGDAAGAAAGLRLPW